MASEAKCNDETADPAPDEAAASVEGQADEAEESTPETVESLREALEQAQAEASTQADRALRAVAEAENVRKRSERSIENAHKFALERFVADLLPAVDSFERAAEAASEADAEGIRLSLKLLTDAMERQGIAVVDPLGTPFDPQLHEAMSMIESPTAEPGSVVEVFQKGYTVNDRLVRPARVIVAKAPAPRKEEPSAGEREGPAPRKEEPSAGEREGPAPADQSASAEADDDSA